MNSYQVYAQIDETGRVTALNSSAFLSDTSGWVLLDEGCSNRFHHAQANYLPQPLRNEQGVYQYKLKSGTLHPRTEEEMLHDAPSSISTVSTGERLTALEQAGLERDCALMELAGMLSNLMGGNA